LGELSGWTKAQPYSLSLHNQDEYRRNLNRDDKQSPLPLTFRLRLNHIFRFGLSRPDGKLFCHTEKDLIYRLPLYKMTIDEVWNKIFAWIELYYNSKRRYTVNERNLPPIKKRALFSRAAA